MLATVLSLAIFSYLSVVGYAVLSLLSEEQPLYHLLLAPAVGATTVMLPTFLLNEAGIPVQYVAHAVFLTILVAALIVLWARGRRIPFGDFWPYALLICFGLLITGWPMLRFGFDWVSFCNDDMANYCMGAERVLHYGYYQPPDARALAGQDYTQFLWFLHLLHRPGSEMVLASLVALTRLSPLQIFMPTIMAFTLCQISAAGGMVFAAIRSRLAVWLTMALVGASALAALGSVYQLIAQVIGLAITGALVAVLMRPLDEFVGGNRVRRGALVGLLTIGVILYYAEMIPFLIIGYAVFIILGWRLWKANRTAATTVLGVAALMTFAVLNRFLPFSIYYVLSQGGHVMPEDPATTRFPYYMMPAGPAYFWGMWPVGQQFPSDLLLSMLVAAGLILSIAAGLLILRVAIGKKGPAIIGVVMGVIFFILFQKPSGFGMYKLAMYLQPFVLTAVVVGWISLWRRPVIQILPLLVLGAIGLRAQFSYVKTSLGTSRGAFGEIPGASPTHIVREYADLLAQHPGLPVEMDDYNPVLTKFQMLEARGRVATFPSNDFLVNLIALPASPQLLGRQRADRGKAIIRDYFSHFARHTFDLYPNGMGKPHFDRFWINEFGSEAISPGRAYLMICQTGRQTTFNRWHDPEDSPGNFRIGPPEDFRNHLIFISSRFGEPYSFGGEHMSLYSLEADPLYPEQTMTGVGRYLLFQAVKPSAKARLELWLTDTLAGNRIDSLPPASVIGTERMPLRTEGRGSARVFSEVLTPQMIGGRPYLAVDMGTAGTFFNYEPRGLMRLWGRKTRLDARQLVGFVRDLSLVSDQEYQSLTPPAAVQTFPEDLRDRNLEYSGIYEDGWVGDRWFVTLAKPPGRAKLVLRLLVPRIPGKPGTFATELTLRVDGNQVAQKTLAIGEAEINVDLAGGSGRRQIEGSFSSYQNLPDPDGRPVGAKLERIAIEPSVSAPVITAAH